MATDSKRHAGRTTTEFLFILFMRGVSLYCLFWSLQYWGMLSGYSMGGAGRFDLLNHHWQVAGSLLAVMFPVACVGAWLTASWGLVVWSLAAATQVAMNTLWRDVFGSDWLLMSANAAVLLLWIAFGLALTLERRHRDDGVTFPSP